MTFRRFQASFAPLFTCLLLVGTPGGSSGQPKGGIITSPPQAPTLAAMTPFAVSRGGKVELTLTGTNLADPTGVMTSFPAKATFPTDAKNGTEPSKLRVALEVPADTPAGFHSIRVATKTGLSNLKLLCVDDLPTVAVTPSRTKATAPVVPIPGAVASKVDAEVSDFVKVSVKPGQRVSFEVLGRRLGSVLDPILILHDARSGRELASLYSDDAPGLQTDPRLTHMFKDGGDFLVEVRDTTHRGGGDFHYLLRIGDFPCAVAPIPAALKRGTKAPIHFAGTSLEGVSPVEVAMPSDPTVAAVRVAPKGPSGLSGWPVSLLASDIDEVVEVEPNNEPAKATRIPVPGGVTGRFLDKGDIDHFVFTAKKGTKYTIEAQTLEIGSPAEVYFVLLDAKGAALAKVNPAQAPKIEYTAAADGDLTIAVEHLNYAAGPNEVYRLTVRTPVPEFEIALGLDRIDVAAGGTAVVPIQAITRRGYAGPVEVTVTGHPGLSGSVTVPANVTAVAPPAANQPAPPVAVLMLTAKPDVPLGVYPVRILGKAIIDNTPVEVAAGYRPVLTTVLGNLPVPPAELDFQPGIGVTEKPPFTLTATLAAPDAIRGATALLNVTAARQNGFADEIVLTVAGLPATIKATPANVAKDKDQAQIKLDPAAAAPLGPVTVFITGKSKFQNREYTFLAAASVNVSLPFELKAESPMVKLAPGAKTKVKFVAVRKGGYAGPIDIEIKNLPANVTAPKATIANDQTAVEVEVTAAANAAEATKADVNAVGTATAAANQQATSPNFTVVVAK